MRFAIFPLHMSKVLRLPRKSEANTQNHFSKPEDLMLENATLSRNQCPDLLTSLMNMSLVLRLASATRNASLQILFKCPTLSNAFETATKPSLSAHFWQGAQSLAPARHNGIWTSKSGPYPSFFYTFDLEMCFAPQRRALFRHVNFQTCSELVSFFHFNFEICFEPQRCALFRHRNFQTCSETVSFLTLLTSKCASRHNGVHFFDISTSKSGPRMVCFAHFDFRMCFAPQRRARAIFYFSSGQMAPHPPL